MNINYFIKHKKNIYEVDSLFVLVLISSSFSTSSVNSVSLWITDTVRERFAFSNRSNKRSTTVSANWFWSTDVWFPLIIVSLFLLYITSGWLVSVSLISRKICTISCFFCYYSGLGK